MRRARQSRSRLSPLPWQRVGNLLRSSARLSCLIAILFLGGTSIAAEGALDWEMEERETLDRSFIVGVVGEPNARPLVGDELERRTFEVGMLLRCPVCQGSAVADSPSPTAINMKNEVRDLLAQGFDQQQILDWFEASYGQFVLMEPKTEGFNLVVWLGPGVVLLAGLGVVLIQLRKLQGHPDEEGGELDEFADLDAAEAIASESRSYRKAPAPDAEAPEDPELERYLREVRELAYGDDEAPSTSNDPQDPKDP